MISFKTNSYVKVWEITDENGVATLRVSTGRKVKENNSYDQSLVENDIAKNGYVNSSWIMRFVGQAYNQLKAYGVEEGSTIINLEGTIERAPYYGKKEDGSEGMCYPKNEKITIFSFELPDNNSSNKNFDKAPTVDDEMPF